VTLVRTAPRKERTKEVVKKKSGGKRKGGKKPKGRQLALERGEKTTDPRPGKIPGRGGAERGGAFPVFGAEKNVYIGLREQQSRNRRRKKTEYVPIGKRQRENLRSVGGGGVGLGNQGNWVKGASRAEFRKRGGEG